MSSPPNKAGQDLNPYPISSYFLENALSAQASLSVKPNDLVSKIKVFVCQLVFYICNYGKSVDDAVLDLDKRVTALPFAERRNTANLYLKNIMTILYLFCKAHDKDVQQPKCLVDITNKLKDLPLKEQFDLLFKKGFPDFENAAKSSEAETPYLVNTIPEITKLVDYAISFKNYEGVFGEKLDWAKVFQELNPENNEIGRAKQVLVAIALCKAVGSSKTSSSAQYNDARTQFGKILLDDPQYAELTKRLAPKGDKEYDKGLQPLLELLKLQNRPFHGTYTIPSQVEKTLNEILSESKYNGKSLNALNFFNVNDSGWNGNHSALVVIAQGMPEPVMKTIILDNPCILIRIKGTGMIGDSLRSVNDVIAIGPSSHDQLRWVQLNSDYTQCAILENKPGEIKKS